MPAVADVSPLPARAHAPPPPPAERAAERRPAPPTCSAGRPRRRLLRAVLASERERFEDRHDKLELPAAALLRAFRPLASALAAAGLAVAHHAGAADSRSSSSSRRRRPRTRRRWRPPAADGASAADAPLIRCRTTSAARAIEQQLARGLPTRQAPVDDAAQLVPAVALDAAALRAAEGSLQRRQAQLLRARGGADELGRPRRPPRGLVPRARPPPPRERRRRAAHALALFARGALARRDRALRRRGGGDGHERVDDRAACGGRREGVGGVRAV